MIPNVQKITIIESNPIAFPNIKSNQNAMILILSMWNHVYHKVKKWYQ